MCISFSYLKQSQVLTEHLKHNGFLFLLPKVLKIEVRFLFLSYTQARKESSLSSVINLVLSLTITSWHWTLALMFGFIGHATSHLGHLAERLSISLLWMHFMFMIEFGSEFIAISSIPFIESQVSQQNTGYSCLVESRNNFNLHRIHILTFFFL